MAKIVLVLIMLSSIYSWELASAALIIFAMCSVLVRNKEVSKYIAAKNICVNKRWDVQYLAGFPSLTVERPVDCSLIIDDNNDLLVLIGKFEEKIPLVNINTVVVASKKTLGIGKMFKINYSNALGQESDIIFKSLNSNAISEAIIDIINRLDKEVYSGDKGNKVIDVESL
ncbi:MAG: hypothetical protein H6Q72_3507 [Firmicutes bacterium]|nr:hypothetical protein [Bacillota bacterium]